MYDIDQIEVGNIVSEVNYIAYFNSPMMPRIGIVLKVYEAKNNPYLKYTHRLAKIYWFKSEKYEVVPIYLLKHYDYDYSQYECEKI